MQQHHGGKREARQGQQPGGCGRGHDGGGAAFTPGQRAADAAAAAGRARCAPTIQRPTQRPPHLNSVCASSTSPRATASRPFVRASTAAGVINCTTTATAVHSEHAAVVARATDSRTVATCSAAVAPLTSPRHPLASPPCIPTPRTHARPHRTHLHCVPQAGLLAHLPQVGQCCLVQGAALHPRPDRQDLNHLLQAVRLRYGTARYAAQAEGGGGRGGEQRVVSSECV